MLSVSIKEVLGSISVVIAVIAFIPYFRETLARLNTPHPFTWFIWGIIGAIVFIAQITERGGAGSWSTGLVGLFCLVIFFLSLRGTGRPFAFPIYDWIALGTSCIAIVLWVLTKDPTGAVVLVSLADSIGYIPTFRKSMSRPTEESISFYTLTVCSDSVAILALGNYAVSTWLYPAMMIVMSGLLVLFLLWRRAAVSHTENLEFNNPTRYRATRAH